MNMCLVSARFPPDRCGVGDYTYFLGNALAQLGHDVHILTGAGSLDNNLYPLGRSLRVHRVVDDWGIGSLPEVVGYLRRLDPEVLLLQYTPHSFARRGITLAVNLLPVLSRLRSRARVIANFHELYIPFTRSPKRGLGALWQRAAAVLTALGSHAISTTATEWRRRLRRLGVRKPMELIPVGSNIPVVGFSDEERARLRSSLLDGETGLLLAGFGAQHDRDVPAVLFGLNRVKRLGPARLVWIGGGTPDRQRAIRIDQAVQELRLRSTDVQWRGFVPHVEASRILGACDVAVLPFIDGVSTRRTSAVSALQHGLPLLTTRGTSLEPLFVHGENVYLVPTRDRQALGDGLEELARKPDLRARLAGGARELYKRYFGWDVIASQVARLAERTRSR